MTPVKMQLPKHILKRHKRKSLGAPVAKRDPFPDPQQISGSTMRGPLAIALAAVAACYAAVASWLAIPYSLIPSDDQYYQSAYLGEQSRTPFLHNPVAHWILKGVNECWTAAGGCPQDTLVITNVLANIATGICIALLLRRYVLARRKVESIYLVGYPALGAALFLVSSWPNTYLFWFSYAPIATAIALACMACTTIALESCSRRRERWLRDGALWILAGALGSAACWTSPSQVIFVGLLLPFVLACDVYRHRHEGIMPALWPATCCAAGFAALTLPFAVDRLPALIAHIRENIATTHYTDAEAKFGVVPLAPFPSFFRILGVHSPLVLAAFLASSAFVAVQLCRRIRFPAGLGERRSREAGVWVSMPSILFLLAWGHALVIDFLPTTKLGRAHFQVYPVVVALIAVWAVGAVPPLVHRLRARFKSTELIAVVMLFVAMGADNVREVWEVWSAKTSLPRFLARERARPGNEARKLALVVLAEDPHAICLGRWLTRSVPSVHMVATGQLDQFIDEARRNGAAGWVIIGPTGTGSGNSVLGHCCLPDCPIEVPRTLPKVTHFPYFAYLPHFMMEEEISQALYCSNKVLNNKDPRAKLTVIAW